jgi:hypothetical protein
VFRGDQASLCVASESAAGSEADDEQGSHADRDPRKAIEGRHDAGGWTVALHQRKHENDSGQSAEIADSAGAALDKSEQPGARREQGKPRQKTRSAEWRGGQGRRCPRRLID